MIIKGIDNSMGVSGISRPFPPASRGVAKGATATEGFTQVIGDMVGKVNEMQNQADKAIQKLATGESKGLHEVMIAMEKSSISFQFLSQVRNKAVEAYQEIMRMQV
jgi:flagellar hook-basal body complex protein FliE